MRSGRGRAVGGLALLLALPVAADEVRMAYTAPSYDASQVSGCDFYQHSCSDLARVWVFLRTPDGSVWTMERKPAAGSVDAFTIRRSGPLKDVEAAAVVPEDWTGNQPDCPLRWVSLPPPVASVEPTPPDTASLVPFFVDVQGRRVDQPTTRFRKWRVPKRR